MAKERFARLEMKITFQNLPTTGCKLRLKIKTFHCADYLSEFKVGKPTGKRLWQKYGNFFVFLNNSFEITAMEVGFSYKIVD